jgi:hypothetical protein
MAETAWKIAALSLSITNLEGSRPPVRHSGRSPSV